MKIKNLCFIFFLAAAQVHGGITYYQGQFLDPDDIALASPDDHYRYACEAYHYHDWKHAIRHFHIISVNFPDQSYYEQAKFYLGVSYFYYGDYEFANQAFTDYLRCSNNPIYIEEALEYKFMIAQEFHKGAKRHMYGSKSLPAVMDAKDLAIDIYDEIITSFPAHNYAAESLFWKGSLLWQNYEYREGVEAFNTLIRRFPHHEKAPESYLMISRLYLSQAQKEFQNPDVLALAELNLKKFEHDFPSEERLDEARSYFQGVKETFAKGLFETGRFFERCKKRDASLIYYQNALRRFPDTTIAEMCRDRIEALDGSMTYEEFDIEEVSG